MIFQLDDELWFPDPHNGEPDGLIAIGGDLSVDRLLLDDYIIEETGRTINWWACGLTFLLVIAAAVWFILRGAPCGAGR